MSTYDKIWWLPICGGLTGLGLVLSYLAMRRRGLTAGLRGAAWSLLPLAAYLTGSVEMFWKIGVAIGDFAKGLVLSTRVWSGIAVAGLALVLFVVTGGLRSRRVKSREGKQAVAGQSPSGGAIATRPAAGLGATVPSMSSMPSTPSTSKTPSTKPAKAKKGASDDDDDLGDVADILRRHGIS
jgi:hypothetical protein